MQWNDILLENKYWIQSLSCRCEIFFHWNADLNIYKILQFEIHNDETIKSTLMDGTEKQIFLFIISLYNYLELIYTFSMPQFSNYITSK